MTWFSRQGFPQSAWVCLLSPPAGADGSHRNVEVQGWAEVFLSPHFRNEIFPGDLLNLPGPTKKGLMLPLLFGAGLLAGLPSQISISSTEGGSDKCQINQEIIPISKIKKKSLGWKIMKEIIQ